MTLSAEEVLAKHGFRRSAAYNKKGIPAGTDAIYRNGVKRITLLPDGWHVSYRWLSAEGETPAQLDTLLQAIPK